MLPFAMSRLVGGRGKIPCKLSILSTATAAKFHHQSAKRITSVHRHQLARVSEQPLDSSTAEDDEGGGRACHPQHITAAQLYRMCRRGSFPAYFDGDVARFHIDPSDFYAVRSRLQALLSSS